jgi:hypothetical protein
MVMHADNVLHAALLQAMLTQTYILSIPLSNIKKQKTLLVMPTLNNGGKD